MPPTVGLPRRRPGAPSKPSRPSAKPFGRAWTKPPSSPPTKNAPPSATARTPAESRREPRCHPGMRARKMPRRPRAEIHRARPQARRAGRHLRGLRQPVHRRTWPATSSCPAPSATAWRSAARRHQDAVPARSRRADRRVDTLAEDARGLYAGPPDARGRPGARGARADARRRARRPVDRLPRRARAARRATGLRRLEKIDLWEISIVTFPMLPEARVATSRRAPSHGALPTEREFERWLTQDAGLTRSQARALMRSGHKASPRRTLLPATNATVSSPGSARPRAAPQLPLPIPLPGWGEG